MLMLKILWLKVHREVNPSNKKYHRHSKKYIPCKTKDIKTLQKLYSKYNKIPN